MDDRRSREGSAFAQRAIRKRGAIRIIFARWPHRHGGDGELERAMIVLFNPWSTPSPKKPLPMSLLAIGSMLEGEFDYRIVDGNLEADPVGVILSIEKELIHAIAVTVMPGPQLRAAVNGCRQLRRMLPDTP